MSKAKKPDKRNRNRRELAVKVGGTGVVMIVKGPTPEAVEKVVKIWRDAEKREK